jgi:hypothetical protein
LLHSLNEKKREKKNDLNRIRAMGTTITIFSKT